MHEEWRPVPGYEGVYDVSSYGRVRKISPHATRGTVQGILNAKNDRYLRVTLFSGNIRRIHSVHCLVAAAFLGPRPHGLVVDHIDGDKHNNRPDNLQYLTPQRNTRKKIESDIAETGVRDTRGKLTQDDVAEIRRLSVEGISRAELGRRYGVAAAHITHIAQGKRWKSPYGSNSSSISV